jgi:hypothetical protein
MPRIYYLLLFLAAVLQADCSGLTKNPGNSGSPPALTISVGVWPQTANVRAGGTMTFTSTVSGSSNTRVTWEVNHVAGGVAATGTISASGVYSAPAALPNDNTITISAVSAADENASGESWVTLWNPIPVLSNITPSAVAMGPFSITINGVDFVDGAVVLLAGTPLATTFISATNLTASGTASTPGSLSVTVTNPAPGSSASGSQILTVTPTNGGGAGNPPLACGVMGASQGGSLNGFVPFPADDLWNTDISAVPVDPNSAALIGFIGASIGLHPDFGSGLYAGSIIGIPYLVVDRTQGPVTIHLTDYADESDPGPMPIPLNAPIEGDPNPSGDQHVLVLDNSNCWLYELYDASPSSAGWSAASSAVWDLTAEEQRPYTWTSADAAGLAIFPGLARYDEVAAGQIQHALRFTLQSSRAAFVPPASHWAATSSSADAAPMGMRLRLRSSFDISGFSAANQVILEALKKYGMIMADNGSSMYISGAPDDRWDNNDLHNLGSVTASDFDVIEMNPVYTAANVPVGSAPVIASFTASSQAVSAGTPVTLQWSVSDVSYVIVSPEIGAVRGTSVVVMPSESTMYTLYATNGFGRTSASLNITVH